MKDGLDRHRFANVCKQGIDYADYPMDFILLAGVRCDNLKAPKNGFVKITGKSIGSKALYSCREGYVLRGDSQRKCQSNGRWSGDMPSCQRQ